MKTKTFSAFFSIIVLLLVSVPVSFAASFSDVAENSVHYNAIEYLKTKGVVSGYSDGTFQPNKTINRAEALKIILQASGLAGDSTVLSTFSDVKSTDWFYSYVQKGVEKDVVKGYEDGTFKPANNINVAESLKIILLSFNIDLPESVSNAPYPDVPKDAWFAPYAEYGKTKQVIWPQDDGNLGGGREISRGEYAQIIYRLLYIKEKNLENFPLSTDWPTYANSTYHYSVKYPFDWEVIDAGAHTIFWKKDKGNNQISFARIFPNSATVAITVDQNSDRLSFDDFVNSRNSSTTSVTQKMTLNNYPFSVLTYPENPNIVDYFFELPNKSIAVAYVNVGTGANRPQLQEEIRNMMGSLRYNENAVSTGSSNDQVLAQAREYILSSGQGQSALDLFDDELIIETDTIGIGTGPVDYYYSSKFDVTLKYERTSATLLALSNGKNTAF